MTPQEHDSTALNVKPSAAPPRQPLASLLEHLVKNGVITKQQAVDAAEWKRRNDKDKRGFPEILEEVFSVQRDPLRQAVAQYYAFRIVSLGEHTVRRLLPSEILKILKGFPEQTMQGLLRVKLLPFDLAENQPDKVVLATPNPADREIHELARQFPFKRFEICYIKESEWDDYWAHLQSGKDKEIASAANVSVLESSDADLEATIDREIARAKIQAQLDAVFLDAVRSNASEIHVAPRGPRKTDILFRLDGHLSLWHSIEDVRCEAVITAVKERSVGIDRYERQAAQHGVMQRTVENTPIRLAVSVLPVVSREPLSKYESVVMRVFRDADVVPRIDKLGLDPHSMQILQSRLAASHGLIVFAGLLRSGISATITAAVHTIMKSAINIVVVQDHVEYIIEGTRQIKLNPRLTMNDALGVIVDQDPDVIVLDDLSGGDVATMALRLATIGHLVLARVPGRSAAHALGHLVEHAGSAFQVAEAVSAVICQLPVRTLCERCRKPLTDGPARLQALNIPVGAGNVAIHRAVGCINCRQGFAGKKVLFEAFAMTPAMRSTMVARGGQSDPAALEAAAGGDGMVTIRAQALEMLFRGTTSIDEILPILQ